VALVAILPVLNDGREAQMKVTLAFACEAAVQVKSGKINAIGILNELYSTEYPFVKPQLSVVTGFEASIAEVGQRKHIQVALHGPDGTKIAVVDGSYTVKEPTYIGRPKYVYAVWDFLGVEFPTPGDHALYILVEGDEKARIPLYVYAPSDYR
jgi:hypothetical protein